MRTIIDEVVEGERKFVVTLIEIDNAVLAFYNEPSTLKLGTLAIATPRQRNQPSASSVFLGGRNAILTKILAERVSYIFNKIAIVSTHFEELSDHFSRQLLKLTQQVSTKATEA